MPRNNNVTENAIASLERTADEWAKRAADMHEAVGRMKKMLNEAAEAKRPMREVKRISVVRHRRAPKGMGAGAACVAILTQWDRPARVNELLDELRKRHVRVGGKRPYATLAATLLKHKGVKRAARGLFEAAVSK
jgi:hypothetical protein